MVRFECLLRSRMSKDAVLNRVFSRKISDGRWVGLGEEHEQYELRSKALSMIAIYRKAFTDITAENNTIQLHKLCVDLKVGYDYRYNFHFIEFKGI